jgi:prepilin-type N-terminal cleavage/methylation domain-containing protein
MVKLLQTLLTYKLKQPKPSPNNNGFTLIELLVGLILSLLVILPLLGFMVNMLQTDRQEQAKASSEQEIQAALSYISRDLEQAVYIYDGYGVDTIKANLPTPPNSVPVLVFWKRQFVPKVIPTGGAQKDDAFTYALVAYYLKTTPQASCTATDTWSCTAQITRVLYRESVKNGKDANGNDIIVDSGDENFLNFGESAQQSNLSLSGVEDIMNAWTSPNIDKTKNLQVLIDYIDQTPIDIAVKCQPIQRTTPPNGVPLTTYSAGNYQQVPLPTVIQASGFYACVDVENTTAQVFIRGNALARLQKKTQPPTYVAAQSAYFPKASIQVKGRGLFSTQQAE